MSGRRAAQSRATLGALVVLMIAPPGAIYAQAAAHRAPVPGSPVGVSAFVGVNVVPMDSERVLRDQTVLIEAGRITALGPTAGVEVPAGAARIDGQGKYLIPGFTDMHVHFTDASPASMERRAIFWLSQGITTARSMDYSVPEKGAAALQLRARAAAGEVWSPRLYVSGPWAPRNALYMHPPQRGPAPAPDSVAAYIAEYQAAGYDHIKLYHEHGVIFDSLFAAAHRAGIPIAGHVPDGVPLEQGLAAGMRSIEHLTGYLPWGTAGRADTAAEGILRLQALAEATRRAGVWNCPTLAIIDRLRPDVVPAVKALHEAGAGLLLCTDDDSWVTPRLLSAELKALVRAGLTPYEALLTGTRNPAVYYGTLAEGGTVAVGIRADVVLLDGDPLADIRYTERPAGVMVGGRWLPRAELERRVRQARQYERQRVLNRQYFDRLGATIRPMFEGMSPTDVQQKSLARLRLAHGMSERAILDSLPLHDSVAAYQRLAGVVARQLGELRAVLSPAEQKLFDQRARMWMKARQDEGYPAQIPGISQ